MIFYYVVGAVFVLMVITAVEERRRHREFAKRFDLEVSSYKRKNAIERYHEPDGWRR